MTRFESHQNKIVRPAEPVFNFVADFTNFGQAIPQQYIENWNASAEQCSFSIKGIGDVAMKITEKKEFSLVKYSNDGTSKVDFNLWIQLKQISENDTRIKITMEVELNMMMKMVAQKPLQQFVNTLCDQIANSFNG